MSSLLLSSSELSSESDLSFFFFSFWALGAFFSSFFPISPNSSSLAFAFSLFAASSQFFRVTVQTEQTGTYGTGALWTHFMHILLEHPPVQILVSLSFTFSLHSVQMQCQSKSLNISLFPFLIFCSGFKNHILLT